MASTADMLKILRPLVLGQFDKEEWDFVKGESKGPGGKDRLESYGKDFFDLTDYSKKKAGGIIKKKKELQEPRGRPPKENTNKIKRRGIKNKRGESYNTLKEVIKKKTGGQIGKPRGWGAARHANN
jgi:hypothetical protein|tara:strand:- start:216 stop:593 length:378 start_codon:yes stop_codon:yes gene_type:complete